VSGGSIVTVHTAPSFVAATNADAIARVTGTSMRAPSPVMPPATSTRVL
jgi:hypothetical protein